MEFNVIHPQWISILLYSYLFVVIANALISCLVPFYYKNVPVGRLTHSQLRVKHGSAEIDHRINVFFFTLVLGLAKWRNIYLAVILSIVLNFLLLAMGN